MSHAQMYLDQTRQELARLLTHDPWPEKAKTP